jgi:hypothetical protein
MTETIYKGQADFKKEYEGKRVGLCGWQQKLEGSLLEGWIIQEDGETFAIIVHFHETGGYTVFKAV